MTIDRVMPLVMLLVFSAILYSIRKGIRRHYRRMDATDDGGMGLMFLFVIPAVFSCGFLLYLIGLVVASFQ